MNRWEWKWQFWNFWHELEFVPSQRFEWNSPIVWRKKFTSCWKFEIFLSHFISMSSKICAITWQPAAMYIVLAAVHKVLGDANVCVYAAISRERDREKWLIHSLGKTMRVRVVAYVNRVWTMSIARISCLISSFISTDWTIAYVRIGRT